MGGDQSKLDRLTYFAYMLETDMAQRYTSVLDLVKAKGSLE